VSCSERRRTLLIAIGRESQQALLPLALAGLSVAEKHGTCAKCVGMVTSTLLSSSFETSFGFPTPSNACASPSRCAGHFAERMAVRHTERYEDGIGSIQEWFHRRTVVQVHNVLLDLSDLMYDAQRELAYTTKAVFALSATRSPSSNQARCVQDMKLTLGRLLSCTHSTQSAHEEV
jgi:hypothetical protein